MGDTGRQIFVRDVPKVAPRSVRPVALAGSLVRGEDPKTFFVLNRGSSRLEVFSDQLESVRHIALTDHIISGSTAHERVRLLPDMRVIVLGLDHITCVNSAGRGLWQFNHPSWPKFVGGDAILAGESLVAVVPTRAARPGYPQVPSGRLVVLNPEDGSMTKQFAMGDDEVEDSPEGFHAVARSDHLGGAFGAGYGQDGSETWRVSVSEQKRIGVRRVNAIDQVISDIGPSADEFLMTPLLTEHLAILSWKGLKEIARLERSDVFMLENNEHDFTADRFDLYAWYLDANQILARTRQGRLLVIDRPTMRVVHELVVPGFGIFGYDQRGKRIDDVTRALDFEGEIDHVAIIDSRRIVVQGAGRSVLCEL